MAPWIARRTTVNHLIDAIDGDEATGALYIYSETSLNGAIRFAGNLVHDVHRRTPDV